MAATPNLAVSLEQAQQIVHKYHSDPNQSTIDTFTGVENQGYSYAPSTKTYQINLRVPGSRPSASLDLPASYFLTVSYPPQESVPPYRVNSLPIVSRLISLVHDKTGIPIPHHTLDTSLTIIPYHYILLALPTSNPILLSTARESHLISAQDLVRIELQLGAYLSQLHKIQNDWFGIPDSVEPADPSYSWQESFTLLLETLLHEVELLEKEFPEQVKLPYEDIRRYLSRAIGFFLFDDVEVPSLIGFTISAHDVLISIPDPSQSNNTLLATPTISAILPNLSWTLWGDPLLESSFMPPGPSPALIEGYTGSGGAPLIVFPRQKTKRIWYSLFLALLVLAEHGVIGADSEAEDTAEVKSGQNFNEFKRKWAKDTIEDCVERLKEAPCY